TYCYSLVDSLLPVELECINPVLYVNLFSLTLQPAFHVYSGTTAISSRSNSLAVTMISDISSRKNAGDIRHRMLNGDNITHFIRIDKPFKQVGIRLVTNCQEQALRWQYLFFVGLQVAYYHTCHCILSQ